MNKHTPGPWSAETWTYKGETDRDIPTIRTTDDAIAQALDLWRDGEDSTTERDANARLIAAAPDLLAALEGLLPLCVPTVSASKTWEAREAARAAIAKARGES